MAEIPEIDFSLAMGEAPRRGRSRPKKVTQVEAKRGRGRPRIHPVLDPDAPPRPRGRPKGWKKPKKPKNPYIDNNNILSNNSIVDKNSININDIPDHRTSDCRE